MRVYLLRLCCSALTLCGIHIALYSQTPDTTKLLASADKSSVEYKNVEVIEAANVRFPEILEDHREHSLTYVEKYSEKKREYVLHTYQKGKKYFPKIIEILNRFQLPQELKVLIALESGFSANLISKAGAVGYWGLMEVAAKEYGLKTLPTNAGVLKTNTTLKDERNNLSKSTQAAAKYLRDRKLNLNNDLLLMVASYNCGLGRVRTAIKRSRAENPGFWEIKDFLPKETRNYVMNFIALNVIFANFENFRNRQMLFSPKIKYNLPPEVPLYNNSVPVEEVKLD